MTTTSEFRLIPMAAVHESKHNPRRHFDGPALEQLAESIRKAGVITPATVRPNGQGFELAAGHRRYRASKLAGLTHLPCIVRSMTDQEFMEVLTIENLQREDVHPLDEAKGYEALMAAPYTMDAEKIAARVGKSVKYIYDRVKLLALSKAAQQLFWDGQIEAGHAILLARLPLTDQAKVIGDKPNGYRNGGLFRIEQLLYDEGAEGEGDNPPIKAVSVRELADYIKRHIRFNAKQADAFLFPETVAQVAEAAEDKRKIIEITHEYLANEDVRRTSHDRVYGERAWKRADGKEGSKECDRSVLGVIASGPGQGEAFKVCINKDRCEVHWGAEIRARQKQGKDKTNGTPASKLNKPKVDTWQQQQEREQKARERWNAAVPAMRTALAVQVKKLPVKAGSALATALIEEVRSYGQTKAIQQMVPIGTSAEDLLRHLGWLYFAKQLEHGENWGAKAMKACGLDPATFLAKPEKAKPPQTSAPKAVRKRKKR